MVKDVSARRVFLASPSGLDEDRKTLRDAMSLYNELSSWSSGVALIPCGWDYMSGGVGRPQTKINAALATCDFMILLLCDRWGSPPGGSNSYESGTEEEFHEAIRLLKDPQAPLRDLWVVCKSPSLAQQRDPGEQLKKVQAFRSKLDASKPVWYEVVDTVADIRSRFERKLSDWVSQPLLPKEAVSITIGAEESVSERPSAGESPESLADRAEKLADQGMQTQAEEVFALAIANKEPALLLRFANFLRRAGRFDGARSVNEDIVKTLANDLSPEARIVAADALANMGLMARKQGKLIDSRQRLMEARNTARLAGVSGNRVLTYALDNLAWTQIRQGDVAEAVLTFEESATVRESMGDAKGVAQSTINIARTELGRGNVDEAIRRVNLALASLDPAQHPRGVANGLALLGQALLSKGEIKGATEVLASAFEINERIGNVDGIAIVAGLQGRVALAQGEHDTASKYARRSLLENQRSQNREGELVATHLLGQIEAARSRWPSAIKHLTLAATLAREIADPLREAAALDDLCKSLTAEGRQAEADAARERLEGLRGLSGTRSSSE